MSTAIDNQRCILVVEDDPWVSTMTTALLASEGYAVVQARNGEEALQLARQLRPATVLLDLALPTTSGLDVLRLLKTDAQTADIPVMVVSAYASMMDEQDARLAEDVVEKPFDIGHLLRQVNRFSTRQVFAA